MSTLRDHYLGLASQKVIMALRAANDRVNNAVNALDTRYAGDVSSTQAESIRQGVEDVHTLASALYNLRCAAAAADLADQPGDNAGNDGPNTPPRVVGS